jgi:hypothetical protein
MADNITANPGAGGATLATDDIGGVQHPRTKVGFGVDGAYVDVSATDPMPITGTQLATLAGTVKIEDTASASGDAGIFMLGVRQDTDTPTAGSDGDYTALKCDEAGRLKVAVQPGGYPLTTGSITSATSAVPVNVSRVSNVMVYVAGTFSGVNVTFEGSLNSTNGTDGNWFAIQAVRSNANTIETTSGVLGAAPAYGWELSVNGLNWFRVRATAWTSGTANVQIQPGAYATEPIPAAQISGTQPVSGTVTANIGTGALAAGTNAIGDTGVQYRANATGAASALNVVAAATTNATVVKASAGRLLGFVLTNNATAVRYVKFHNQATAPTAGSGVVQTYGIPPNGGTITLSVPGGVAFTTGVGMTIVTGAAATDATAVALNDVVGTLHFA